MTPPIALPLDLPEIAVDLDDGARFRRSVLPSGVRLLTESVPGVASATIGVWVPVGSRDEPDALGGSSHFLEHLLFKGTATRSAREISLSFERVGGDFNAETTREHTLYYARLRSGDLGMAIDVLGEMMRASRLDERDLEIERGVILEELAAAEDDPDDLVWDLF